MQNSPFDCDENKARTSDSTGRSHLEDRAETRAAASKSAAVKVSVATKRNRRFRFVSDCRGLGKTHQRRVIPSLGNFVRETQAVCASEFSDAVELPIGAARETRRISAKSVEHEQGRGCVAAIAIRRELEYSPVVVGSAELGCAEQRPVGAALDESQHSFGSCVNE